MFTESQSSLLVYCRVRLNFICLLSTCIPFTYRLFLSFQRFPYLSALFLSVGASIGSDRFCRYHYKLSDSTFALASTKFFYINHVDALLDRSSCSKKFRSYTLFLNLQKFTSTVYIDQNQSYVNFAISSLSL